MGAPSLAFLRQKPMTSLAPVPCLLRERPEDCFEVKTRA